MQMNRGVLRTKRGNLLSTFINHLAIIYHNYLTMFNDKDDVSVYGKHGNAFNVVFNITVSFWVFYFVLLKLMIHFKN